MVGIRRYRIIDFKEINLMFKESCFNEYDPNRSSRIALVLYDDNEKRYIIAPDGLKLMIRLFLRKHQS